MSSLTRILSIFTLLAILSFSSQLSAQDNLSTLSDEMLQERISYIQNSFDNVQTKARWWSWGWIGAYTGITGYGVYGLVSDWPDNKAYNIVGVTKTTLSISLLLFLPFHPRYTASEFKKIPGETREEKIAKLQKGEWMFKRNYKKSRSGVHWLKSHVLKIGVNLIGGGIVWYFDGWKRGLLSAGLGILVSQATIWTQPTGQIRDYREYMEKYYNQKVARPEVEPGWFATPLPGGFMAGMRF